MNTTNSNRILVVDDNPGIREDFKKVLAGDKSVAVDAVEDALFGNGVTKKVAPATYELDLASQGQEALAMVVAAKVEGKPYSVAFVDMRMPPGWDGAETISHIWEKDPEIQVVICTAYSDYTWQDIIDRLGQSDRLLILKKPFDVAEICQLASALTQKWALARRANLKTAELEGLVLDRTADLLKTNAELERTIEQLHKFYGMEFERNQLRESLQAMEKVVEIIGKEMRTPLGCIRGLSDMMTKTATGTDKASVAILEGINLTTGEMAQVLDRLLEAARLQAKLTARVPAAGNTTSAQPINGPELLASAEK